MTRERGSTEDDVSRMYSALSLLSLVSVIPATAAVVSCDRDAGPVTLARLLDCNGVFPPRPVRANELPIKQLQVIRPDLVLDRIDHDPRSHLALLYSISQPRWPSVFSLLASATWPSCVIKKDRRQARHAAAACTEAVF